MIDSAPGSGRGRSLRADARRNEAKILQAAIEVFEQHGIDAPIEAVVRRAGVSTGTLYNHFRNRRNLVHAVVPTLINRATERTVRRAMTHDDPWERFVRLVEGLCECQAADPKLVEIALRRFVETGRLEVICGDLSGQVDQIFEDAKRAGALREDVTLADLLLFTIGVNTMIVRASSEPVSEAWRRYLGIVLDGLHAAGSGTLAGVPLDLEDSLVLIRRIAAPKRAAA